jgi:hypothetical protein
MTSRSRYITVKQLKRAGACREDYYQDLAFVFANAYQSYTL